MISLRDLISELGEKKVSEMLSSFDSGVNDMDSFIRYHAISYHKSNVNRVYVIFKDRTPAAYFSIAVTSILIDKGTGMDEELRRTFNIVFGQAKGGYIIGHIAKTKGAEKGMIDLIIPMALSAILEAQKVVGGNIVCLDCDSKVLEKKYAAHGFVAFGSSPDYVGKNFKRMFLALPKERTVE